MTNIKPKRYWNQATLLESSLRCNTVFSWSKSELGDYIASRILGLFKDLTRHIIFGGEFRSKFKTVWIKEKCIESAKN